MKLKHFISGCAAIVLGNPLFLSVCGPLGLWFSSKYPWLPMLEYRVYWIAFGMLICYAITGFLCLFILNKVFPTKPETEPSKE